MRPRVGARSTRLGCKEQQVQAGDVRVGIATRLRRRASPARGLLFRAPALAAGRWGHGQRRLA